MPATRDQQGELLSLKIKIWGLELSEAKRLKQLEDENRQLKHVVADLTLDNRALKAVLAKKW